MSIERYNIAIIDNHTGVRHDLIGQLRTRENLTLVGVGVDARDACKIAQNQSPDIMVVGRDIPGGGVATVRAIKAIQQSTQCIILAPDDDAKISEEVHQAGAIAYVKQEFLQHPLLRVIESVLSGKSV